MIENMSPRSGRVLREDDSYINIADFFPGVVSGKVVGNDTVEFGAGSANTLKEIEIELSENIKSALRLEVENPSGVSDLTVEVYDTLDSKDYFVAWFTIPRKTTRTNGKEVQAHTRQLPAVGCRGKIKVALSNDQAITTGFTVNITIREV
ncbi:MAG: hypothetical protein WBJ87_01125 [Candidatus Hydrothermia bacterium]